MRLRLITAVIALPMVVLGVPLSPSAAVAAGTITLVALDAPYIQTFDTLATSGTANTTLPDGWAPAESGTSSRNNGAYAASTGSDTAGDVYSFGSSGSTERAFGTLLSGTLTPTIGASFTNSTGSVVTTVAIAYVGEQWRFGATGRGPDRLDFQYSLDATSLTTGVWTNADALDFASPVTTGTIGALDGNNAANRTTISAAIENLAIANGATFWIRWSDFNASSSDDGLGVDELSLTPSVDDTPPSVAATSPAAGATGVAMATNISITFSEPVNVTGAWYSISCAVSGEHTASVTGGPTTFALDPSVDFAAGEVCTIVVVGALVTDQDTDDPPDTMTGDATFSFTTTDQVCGAPATFIHTVQGSAATSPLVGSTVSIEGIVVGDYQQPGGFSGFYVQEEAADADSNPLTSEGVFVFNTSFAVNAGDVVRLRGTVLEFSGLTEITSVNTLLICASGASVPATTLTLPVAAVSDLERYEGMLVNFAQTLTATEVFSLGRFGEVSLSGAGRLYIPTAITTPGAAAIAQLAENNRSRIILDDGNNLQNIDPTLYPQGGLSASNTLRVGDTLAGLTGVMDFRFNNYRIQPVAPINWNHTNPRPTAPAPVGGNFTVASFNVLNFFNGDGLGGGFPTARGATTPIELARQLAKEVSALSAIDADIVGLMEIENDGGPTSALADLVAALNAAMGAGTYSFIDTGVIGTDQIKVALIYKPSAVTPRSSFQILTSGTDPRFIDTLNRPALAQTFEHVLTGQTLTVVVNHLKSKGSACAGDPDIGDGQGNCNRTRTAAAAALADWIAGDPTGSGDPDFLMIGDLNSYTFEDPITTLTSAGLVNLVREFGGLTPYSFVFMGESGYLDHALATSSLAPQVTGVTEWHINPDEPTVLDYNMEFKSLNHQTTLYDDGPYRSSDHDPVIVGLRLASQASSAANVEGAPLWPNGLRTKVNVSAMDGRVDGRVLIEGAGLAYEATRIDSLVADGYDATIFGAFGTVQFRLDVHDGRGGGGDTLRLRTSAGYDSGVLSEPRGHIVVNVR